MNLPTVDELETWILGIYYRTRHQGMDRRADGKDVGEVDYTTGLPQSANDLKPERYAKVGTGLALEVPIDPKKLARSLLVCDDGTSLDLTPPEKWTPEDHCLVGEISARARVAMQRMIEHGWLKTGNDFEGNRFRIDADRDDWHCYATYAGLEHAEKVIANDPKLNRGPVSILNALPAEARSVAPQYAVDQWRRENRA
jgi:hypothetical protein